MFKGKDGGGEGERERKRRRSRRRKRRLMEIPLSRIDIKSKCRKKT